MINIPKGTKDVLPKDVYKWQYIESLARQVASLFNAKEIRTPVFEHTELFLRGVGDTTDIVNKEMYTFMDKGNRSMTLKPEGTAGVARSFIENGLFNEQMPLKVYYFTPVFRYERPQSGRLREHHQFGIEIFGSDDARVDAELIMLADMFFKKLKVQNLQLYINSIGCSECRAQYNEALKKYYSKHLKNMCPQCNERFEKNPLRMLDCKEEACSKINEAAPSTIDYLCDSCSTHFKKLQSTLKDFNIDYKINDRIVRGLDYYTKTVFEFVSLDLGAKSTVCGGGRYNGLIEQLGGKQISGTGFGIGLERLLLMLENLNINIPALENIDVYIVKLENSESYVNNLLKLLRDNNLRAETDFMERSLKAQFKYADNICAKNVIVIGESEVKSKSFVVKNMNKKEETKASFDNVVEILKRT